MSVPGRALLSAPAPETLAASVSVSMKFAAIWPSLTIAGVTIAPANPPAPRLSVLPAPIDVAPGELTTPPSAMVSVPTGLQPQPPPIASELNAFKTEPAPVTIKLELPLTSPMIVDVVELTTPPLAMMSAPGPTVTSPTKRPKGPPTFQVEPGPVTVAVGVPRKGRKLAMSALPWLLSTPPLLMMRDAGAKLPMIVSPVTVTLEPAPVITALPATPKLVGGGGRAVGDGERSAVDDRRAADGERAAADRERRARACAAEREIAADGADVAAVAGAGQRQRSRVVELERAPAGERAGERGGAVADDAQQGGRTGRSDRDRAAARQRPDLDKGPVADRQGRARVDGEDRFK